MCRSTLPFSYPMSISHLTLLCSVYRDTYAERWSDVVDLIASDYASPAASRLAVRLVFAVYVLPIDLRGSSQQHLHSWPEEG